MARPNSPRSAGSRSGALHAGAWWVWALGLATAASRTTNPLLLALLMAVAGYVVAARRTAAPWARSYGAFLKLALLVLGIRLVFAFFLGSSVPGTHTVVTLPEVPLPDWAQGVRLGGRVTVEGLVFALYDALKLAALLVCVGAANALANPARLLKSLPAALYEAGVAVVVAMTFAPNLVADVQRLRAARRLRGRADRGLRGLLQVGLPVLEGALERSVGLAAAMDSRGYGRTAEVPRAVRRTTAALTLGGLLGICVGSYALLAAEGAAFGLPLLLCGMALALAGLWLGGQRSVRTRYRPDRWGPRAWLVSASGVAVAALLIRAGNVAPEALHPAAVPLAAPRFPLWPAGAALLGLLPAFVAPVPGRPADQPGTGHRPQTGPHRPGAPSSGASRLRPSRAGSDGTGGGDGRAEVGRSPDSPTAGASWAPHTADTRTGRQHRSQAGAHTSDRPTSTSDRPTGTTPHDIPGRPTGPTPRGDAP